MIAKGGATLLAEDAIQVVADELIPLATLVTPNLPEAERLAGMTITSEADMAEAAHRLQAKGAQNVLIKGGHGDSDEVRDLALLASGETFWVSAPRVATIRTHGTGDTLSSCITSELAKGRTMAEAIHIGKRYVEAAIQDEIQVGHGHSPLNHWAYRKVAEDENSI